MKRTILVFGTISGLIVSAFMATSMAIAGCAASEGNMTGGMIIGFASMVVAFSFVFVGIKNFRDKQNNGVVTFGKAFLIGVLISFIASTLYVITWAIEYHYFLPDFMEKYATMQLKQIQSSGMSADKMQEAIEEVKLAKYRYENSSVFFTLYTYMEIFPVGILIALISAAILRRKTKKTDAPAAA